MSSGFALIRPMLVNDAALLSSNVAETDYTLYAAGTTYNLNDYVRVVTTDTHQVYQSLLASNIGNTPAANPTKWLFIGNTNRWMMFDQSVTSQTTNPVSIVCSFLAAGRVDSVGLLNVTAQSATITMTDAIDGLVYNKTISLISPSGITDWYAYFFEPIVLLTDLSVTDMPPYYNATIGVTLNYPASIAACGACILGQSKVIGTVQYGVKVGIVDYSVKQKDTFGNTTILQRAYSKRATYTIWVNSSLVDQLQTLLALYRATPILYIGSDSYASTLLYGFYKDFEVDISYPTVSVCSIQLEGLT